MRVTLYVVPLVCAGCVSTNAAVLDKSVSYQKICPDGVQIFTSSERVSGPYVEVALLNSKGESGLTSEQGMAHSQQQKAAQLGANGIIIGDTKEPNAGTKIIGSILGTGAERKGKAVAIFIPSDSMRVQRVCNIKPQQLATPYKEPDTGGTPSPYAPPNVNRPAAPPSSNDPPATAAATTVPQEKLIAPNRPTAQPVVAAAAQAPAAQAPAPQAPVPQPVQAQTANGYAPVEQPANGYQPVTRAVEAPPADTARPVAGYTKLPLGTNYVGDVRIHVYYPLGCAAQHAIPADSQVFFQTAEGALRDGFVPSGDC